jgi:hypothetical protein
MTYDLHSIAFMIFVFISIYDINKQLYDINKKIERQLHLTETLLTIHVSSYISESDIDSDGESTQ